MNHFPNLDNYFPGNTNFLMIFHIDQSSTAYDDSTTTFPYTDTIIQCFPLITAIHTNSLQSKHIKPSTQPMISGKLNIH